MSNVPAHWEISMCTVPVSIKHKNNGKQITTYPMFDNCSQSLFVHEAVLKQLGAKGTKTTLSLNEDLTWGKIKKYKCNGMYASKGF